MDDGDKELWQAFLEWLEIVKETNERLNAVRRELAEIERKQR